MKREEQRVLAGSLNVLTPTDKTPENDAIELINFRVDQAGVLRVGDSYDTSFLTEPGFLPGPIHTLVPLSDLGSSTIGAGLTFLDVQFPPNTFLAGVGTNLYLCWPRNAQLLAQDFDGQPLSIVPWNGFLWVMNQAKQLVLYPAALSYAVAGQPYGAPETGAWLPPAPPTSALTAAPEGDASADQPNGTYQYYVTFVSLTGLETNPGPASDPATITPQLGGGLALNDIPISSDPQVWARRIYRIGGTLGQAYQIAQLGDNTSTGFYLDEMSDLDATELGIVMPTTNDPPPAALGLAGPYFNYLLAWNDPYHGNRLFWSQNGVALFPGSQPAATTGNWVDVGAPDDHVLAVSLHTSVAVIYKQRSIWRLRGDPVSGVLEQCSASIGAAGPKAVANAGPKDYLVSTDGLFRFNLDFEEKVSEKLDPIFFGTPNWTSLGDDTLPLHRWQPVRGNPVVCAWLNGTVLLSDGAGTAFLYHEKTDRFAALESNLGAPITAVAPYGSAYQYWIGDTSVSGTEAHIAMVEQITGSGQTAIWQTRFLDQGLGDQPKSYYSLALDAELNGATANVYVLYGGVAGRTLLEALSGEERQKFYIDLADTGGNLVAIPPGYPNIGVRIEIACLAGTVPPAIHGLYIYYEIEARATANLATQPFPLDAERGVWQIKELEYDLRPQASEVIAEVFTDLPGNTPALRQADALSLATPGFGSRRNYQCPTTGSAGYWTGRLLGLNLTSALPFQLYGARALARKVGTYIEAYEAQKGFRWDSWWLNFASVQVKTFDQVKLEIDTTGDFTVFFSTELPGEDPLVVWNQTLSGTSARRWYTVELPAGTIGRDCRVQIAFTADATLYSGSVSMRLAGRYLSATQGDQLRTLEQDFSSERVKLCKKLEVDLNGAVTLTVWTNEPGGLAARFAKTLDSGGIRRTMLVRLPPNVRGRLWRIDATTPSAAFLYAIRGWMRVTGEAGSANWAWQEFALEPSETLPRWADLPVVPTPEEWTWVPVPLETPDAA